MAPDWRTSKCVRRAHDSFRFACDTIVSFWAFGAKDRNTPRPRISFTEEVGTMAAVKCAAAAVLTAARGSGTAAAAAAPPAEATTATLPRRKTGRAATKSETPSLTAEPSVQRVTGSRLATPAELVRVSAVTEALAISLQKPHTLKTPRHFVRSNISFPHGVVCLPVTRRLSSYARFAQYLRSRYNSTTNASAPSTGEAVMDSFSRYKDGSAVGTNSVSSTKQSKSHFAVNGQQVLVSSTSTVPGYAIVSYKGFVQGCSVQARDMLLMSKVFLLVQFGGELQDMASLMQRAKAEAIEQVCREAAAIGANGVIGVRLVSSGTHQRTAVEFSAYGTAVLMKKAA